MLSVFVAASTRCFADRPFDEACRELEDLEFERLEVGIDEAGRHLALKAVTANPENFAAAGR